MKTSLNISKDFKLLLEAAAVLAVAGLAVWFVSNAVISASLKEAAQADRTINTAPVSYKESANIKVATPKDGDTLSSSFLLSGQAQVFEGVVNFRLKDSTGKLIAQGTAQAKAGQAFSPFSYEVAFTKPSTSTGTVEVFQKSAKDGSDQDLVTISVKF